MSVSHFEHYAAYMSCNKLLNGALVAPSGSALASSKVKVQLDGHYRHPYFNLYLRNANLRILSFITFGLVAILGLICHPQPVLIEAEIR